jgi:tetratricopeptide (TPR) repeat protein
MMKFILRSATALLTIVLMACASQKEKSAVVEALSTPAPSYNEKIAIQSINQLKGPSCPTDSKWEASEWRNVVALANACVKAKDWLKVERMGNVLAKNAHLTPWGPYYMSLSAESRHDYPRAIWMLELALKKDPNEGLFHYELGRIHWEMNDDQEALQHLKMASDLNPGLTDAHWVMGEMAVRKQDLSAADTYYQRALATDAKHMPSLLSLASLKINGKDWAKSEEYLSRILAVNPNNGRVRLELAQVQEEHLKKLPEALQNYRQLKQLQAQKKSEPLDVNVDDKIHSLEKNLAQAAQESRKPTAAERAN